MTGSGRGFVTANFYMQVFVSVSFLASPLENWIAIDYPPISPKHLHHALTILPENRTTQHLIPAKKSRHPPMGHTASGAASGDIGSLAA